MKRPRLVIVNHGPNFTGPPRAGYSVREESRRPGLGLKASGKLIAGPGLSLAQAESIVTGSSR